MRAPLLSTMAQRRELICPSSTRVLGKGSLESGGIPHGSIQGRLTILWVRVIGESPRPSVGDFSVGILWVRVIGESPRPSLE